MSDKLRTNAVAIVVVVGITIAVVWKLTGSHSVETPRPSAQPETSTVHEEPVDAEAVAPTGATAPIADPAVDVEQPKVAPTAERLEAAAPKLVVHVVDDHGAAVPDAKVSALELPLDPPGDRSTLAPSSLRGSLAKASALTDESGLADLPLCHCTILIAEAPGFAPGYGWPDEAPSDLEAIEIHLDPSASVHGKVITAESRERISGARIVTWPRSRSEERSQAVPHGWDRIVVGDTTVSDASGSFRFDSLRSEPHEAWCFAPGWPPMRMESYFPLGDEIVFRLAETIAATGVVRDREGRPIDGARVMANQRGILPCAIVAETRSGADGTFKLDAVPCGSMSIAAIKNGFATTKIVGDLAADEKPFFELVMDAEAPLRGMVVDDAGQLVEGATVDIVDLSINAEVGFMTTYADGKWYMPWIHAGTPLAIEASCDGYRTARRLDVTAPNEEVRIVLERLPTMHGFVKDDNGRPVTDFVVAAMRVSASEREEPLIREGAELRHVQSPTGEFTMDGFGGGTVELRVEAAGFAPAIVEGLSVPPGAEFGPVSITLHPGADYRARLVDSNGTSVAAATATVLHRSARGHATPGPTSRRATSDGDGQVILAGLGASPFDLMIAAPRFGEVVLSDRRAGGAPEEVMLQPAGSIEGTVRVPWPSPETTSTVFAYIGDSWCATSTHPDGDGRFTFPELAPGLYRVELLDEWSFLENYLSEYRPTQWVEVPPGGRAEVMLSTGGGGSLHGTVQVRPAATQLPDLVLKLLQFDDNHQDRRVIATAPVDSIGRYQLYGLEPGRYIVELTTRRPGDALHVERAVDLSASQSSVECDLDVTFEPLVGTVHAPGATLSGVIGRLIRLADGAELANTCVAADGHYRIHTDERGRCLLWFSGAGLGDDWSRTLTLPAAAGEAIPDVSLVAEARLKIEVRDDGGQMVEQATVALELLGRPAFLPAHPPITTGGGRAEFSRLPAIAARVHASAVGHVPTTTDIPRLVAGEAANVVIRLVHYGSLRVEVRRASRKSAEGCQVTLRSADDAVVNRDAVVTVNGQAVFRDLLPGSYFLAAEGSSSTSVTIKPGSETAVKLELP